jgi:hypothetical protein
VSRQRSIVVWVLTVVSCVLVVLSTVALGVQQILLNTDRWVAVVGPLASNPTVQSSVADAVSAVTLNALDVQGRAQSLPGPLARVAASADTRVATVVDSTALQVVQSDQFQSLWTDVNRAAHEQIVEILRGQVPAGDAVTVSNGEVEVNVLAVVQALIQRAQPAAPDVVGGPLFQAVRGQLAPDFGYVGVVQASTLATAQRTVQLIDDVTLGLLVMALVLLIVTLAVSSQRRVTTQWLGAGVALGLVLAWIGLLVVQSRVMSVLGDRPISAAVETAVGAVVMNLAQGMLVVFVVAAGISAGAFVTGRLSAR